MHPPCRGGRANSSPGWPRQPADRRRGEHGAPVLLPWAEDVPAVLLCWFPGQEFGNALADVLLGWVESGGRLPTTWPAVEAGLPSVTPVEGTLRYDEGLSHRLPRLRPGRPRPAVPVPVEPRPQPDGSASSKTRRRSRLP